MRHAKTSRRQVLLSDVTARKRSAKLGGGLFLLSNQPLSRNRLSQPLGSPSGVRACAPCHRGSGRSRSSSARAFSVLHRFTIDRTLFVRGNRLQRFVVRRLPIRIEEADLDQASSFLFLRTTLDGPDESASLPRGLFVLCHSSFLSRIAVVRESIGTIDINMPGREDIHC